MARGRTTEARTVTVGKTNASTAITAAAGTFGASDVGRTIVGTNIPAAATITAVASDTAATLSANATGTTSNTAVIGASTGLLLGFTGWSPETELEATSYTVAAANAGTPVSPDRITGTATSAVQRART